MPGPHLRVQLAFTSTGSYGAGVMLRRLCIFLVMVLLAFGQPLHAANAADCMSGHEETGSNAVSTAHHCHDHCGKDFGASVCQTLCNSVAALPEHAMGRALPIPYAVEFFPERLVVAHSADISPEPFPPRTSILS